MDYKDKTKVELKNHLISAHMLLKGINGFVEEVIPVNEREEISMYHASPAYGLTRFSVDENNSLGGFYRELMVDKHVQFTYYTIGFTGGHIGLVFDGKKSQVNLNIWNSNDGNASIFDKHPDAEVKEVSNGVCIYHPYMLKEGTKYKFFVRVRFVKINNTSHTVYSCYFGLAKTSFWKYIGTISRPGNHGIKHIGSSIENIGAYNGHLYTRSMLIGNNWIFDSHHKGHYCTDLITVVTDNTNTVIQKLITIWSDFKLVVAVAMLRN